jgi:tripartite-type tricarboxylate transporter receptor subunit TctC
LRTEELLALAKGATDTNEQRGTALEASAWTGVCVPRKPARLAERLNSEFNGACADPYVKVRFADLGSTALSRSPADFGRLVADQTEKSAKVIRVANH